MIPSAPRAEVVAIKTALSSILTCSSSTVAGLNELLSSKPSAPRQDGQSQLSSKNLPTARGTTKLKPSTAPKSKAKPKVSVLEIKEEQQPLLTLSERYTLATETINITLKLLTEAIKSPPQSKRQPSPRDVNQLQRSTSARKLLSRSASAPQKPLEALSPNRLSSSPSKPSTIRRSSSSASFGPAPGLVATAECARLGFACMRSLSAQKVTGIELPPLQLETGMSALVAKLIILGLDDLATKELRILKRRLEVHIAEKDSVRCNGSRATEKIAIQARTSSETEGLAVLLHFDSTDCTGSVLQLVITTQIQVLKLIASKKRPSIIEAAFDFLSSSSPSSPINNILKSSSEPSSAAKAARQLEMLSQLVLSLCPSISSSEDVTATNAKISISPDVSIRMQSLAFRIRSLWWDLASHEACWKKELIEPFSRCLAAYIRRSRTVAEEKYARAAAAWNELDIKTGMLGSQSIAIAKAEYSTILPLYPIYKALGLLAQDANLVEEAIQWTKGLIREVREGHASGAQTCACDVRLAALTLRKASADGGHEDVNKMLSQAIEALKGNLKGTGTELDDLLVEVAALRRAATVLLIEYKAHSESSPETSLAEERESCLTLVFACIQFFVRYLGTYPVEEAGVQAISRYKYRIEKLKSVASAAIDAIVSILKNSIAEGGIPWEKIDAALQDCCFLASNLQEDDNGAEGKWLGARIDKQLPHVKISNIYWALYLKLKPAGSSSSDLSRCLLRSVNVMHNRPPLERAAAFVAVKYERLGGLYHLLRRFETARVAFLDSVRAHIDDGVARSAATAAATKSVKQIWEEEGQVGICGRVIRTWIKSFARDDVHEVPTEGFYDSESLKADERGILLEWQATVYLEVLESGGSTERYKNVLTSLAEALLKVYEATVYPVRRCRVILMLLRLSSNYYGIFDTEFMDKLVSENAELSLQVHGSDGGLMRFHGHLQATSAILLAFRQGRPSMEDLSTALAYWSTTLQTSETWASLIEKIDDVPVLLSQLESISDYLDMQGFDILRIPTLTLITKMNDLFETPDHTALVTSFSNLGLQYLRLGYSGKAGLAFSKAKGYLDHLNCPAEISLQWHLAYAEYLLDIGNLEKCEESLRTARSQAEDHPNILKDAGPSATISGRIRMNKLIAKASYVYSVLAFEKGSPDEALAYAKRCVKLGYRAWACHENLINRSQKQYKLGDNEADMEALAEGLSKLTTSAPAVPSVMSSTPQSLNGPTFWTLVPLLQRGLLHLSALYSHQGMFQEAIYCTEQANKIVVAVNASSLVARNLAVSGDYWARSGDFKKGERLLNEAIDLRHEMGDDKDSVMIQCYLANIARLKDDQEGEIRACENAVAKLQVLTNPEFINQLHQLLPQETELEGQMTKLTLEKAPRRTAATRKGKPAALAKTSKVMAKSSTTTTKTAAYIPSECPQLLRLKGDILRRKACVMIKQHRVDMASSLLLEVECLSSGHQGIVQQRLGTARKLLSQGIEGMSADAVFCVLPESTISFPSIASAAKNADKQMRDRSSGRMINVTPPRKSPAKSSPKKGIRSKSPARLDFMESLFQARENVSEIHSMAMQMCSTANVHTISAFLSGMNMLVSAGGPTRLKGTVHPIFAGHSIEIARTISLNRETSAILIDKQPTNQEDLLKWPGFTELAITTDVSRSTISRHTRFQKDYIDIIPPSWTSISISLSENRDELFISKLRAGQTPFILRLPLGRHNSRDADEEVFDLDQGKRELLEIIELANFSAHDARDMTAKKAKSEWWAEREALDARLKDLLTNIENLWLGGFRGIFSPHTRRPELLSRFQQSFQNILEKYLPSRQKVRNKRTKAGRVTLDPRILELFVGLGDSDSEELDLEEPLTDLLYFVVDVLQFHGERNAYDEIDLDSIIVEVQDALRCYHEAAKSASNDQPTNHTILILDKSLHVFPWESLPCLSSVSVSRLPSLGSLRDIIQSQQQQSETSDLPPFHTNRGNGSYILNPAGDLKATQIAFQRPLETHLLQLGSWSGLTATPPTQSQMKSALSDSSIFLYFGHGSGSQYVPARTIRRLDHCAVAFLMGCSSGALTEAGEFESFGTPRNYLLGGCPSVVAMLWDVTDRDCDRFAGAALEEWGLWAKGEVVVGGSRKGSGNKEKGVEKGRSRSREGGESSRSKNRAREEGVGERGDVSLSMAVAKSREKCFLRYLNGAAPVVYGVPVWLGTPSSSHLPSSAAESSSSEE
ncbi:MAG: hypothetical protein M1827_000984 [Pycnora praestabilis]|nr:MAG: hypothetical protein M1827_000984 [Pycnora praestabilis]